ncbi:hypothetical protein OXX80_011410, partial [Metschnikowia pulcherrima]
MNNRTRGTDIRVILPSGAHVILQCLYLPTGNKRLQAEILQDMSFGFECLADSHPGLELFFGGDLNHSMEHTAAEEREPRLMILDVSRKHKLEDVAAYERSISSFPTNKSRSCRRIDRFYAPISWKSRALSYQVTKPPVITSSHHLIAIEFRIDSVKDLQMGEKRFKFPLIRLSPPFSNCNRMPIDLESSMDEAMYAIKCDGMGYISFMGYVRKHNPSFAKAILAESYDESEAEHYDGAMKTFFQAKRVESTVFTYLSNASSAQEADSTLGMLTLATDYYRELYQKPPDVSEQAIHDFLDPVRSRLSAAERVELDTPFVADELYSALRTANMATSPGPDGIQFPVLESYWDKIGPILTNAANNMMKTGSLPECFKVVWITLIPKSRTAESTEVKDQRPISLTNTALKVIARAVCTRLHKVLDKLISPHQRGFMKNRRINHNTMEFFTLVQLFQSHRARVTQPKFQAILMADFTKAFDRISHQYLRAVFTKMGFGSDIIRLLTSILEGQVAQLFLNNCEGPRFPLQCGTRQGNPLSPLLFNLALEPFLVHLGLNQGLKVMYHNCLLFTMKFHAFADDVNIYLNDIDDYERTARVISNYENVSNSKVSAEKSKLIGFHRSYPSFAQAALPYTQSHIKSEQATYLGISIQGVDWNRFISKLPFMTRQHGYRQLDLISRALGTNIFVCSKTVYKDLVQCMTKTELRKIDLCIQRMFPGISPAKLHARPKKGGYGLIELSTQLLGHRAEVIGETLSQANGWFIQYLRVKMLHHMAKILAGNEHTRVLKTGGLHWLQFLLEKTDIFEKNLHWTFSSNEIHYIRAWREVTYKSTEYDVTKQPYITSESTLMETVADGWLPRAVAEKVSQVQYKSLSRKKQEALLPLTPRR